MAISTIGKHIMGYQMDWAGASHCQDDSVVYIIEGGDFTPIDSGGEGGVVDFAHIYKGIIKDIRCGAKVVAVICGDSGERGDAIKWLMASYGLYDIYNVADADTEVTAEFIDCVTIRTVSAEEAAMVTGADMVSADNLTSAIFEIYEAACMLNSDALKKIIEANWDTLKGGPDFINGLRANAYFDKSQAKSVSTDETADDCVNGTKEELMRVVDELGKAKADLEQASEEIRELEEKVDKADAEKEELNEKIRGREEAFDAAAKEAAELRAELSATANKLAETTNMLNDAQDKLAKAQSLSDSPDNGRMEALEAELKASQSRVTELESRINNSGPTIKTYTTVDTRIIGRCSAKSVLYFKEVTSVRYFQSMLLNIYSYIESIKKIKVKLVVYDNAHSFVKVYKPMTPFMYKDYLGDKETVVSTSSKILLTEPNPAILEDILKDDWDVVIVFDRLKQMNDIVTGNNVYKYWVVNSYMDFLAIKGDLKIEPTYVITGESTNIPGAMHLGGINGYREKHGSAKLQEYKSMADDDGQSILLKVLDRANIGSISPRARRGV